MSIPATTVNAADIEYPDCDGNPGSDNTLQWQWMVSIKENLEDLFRDDTDVFVAGDLLWYPVEGSNTIRCAPDMMVAFGRPKGYRGSYMQWREGGIPPQVVFEILSPGNRYGEMMNKVLFYARHGVEEYYIFNPDTGELDGLLQREGSFHPVSTMQGWVSPRLGVRFETIGKELCMFRPNGQPFMSFMELSRRVDAAQREAADARQRAEESQQRAERFAAKLRELGVDPDA